MLIKLVYGDTARREYGRTDSILVESNKSVVDVEKAFNFGTNKILGLRFYEYVGQQYGNPWILSSDLDKLRQAGFDKKIYGQQLGQRDQKLQINKQDYIDMWMFIAKLGDPSLELKAMDHYTMHIGGVGVVS